MSFRLSILSFLLWLMCSCSGAHQSSFKTIYGTDKRVLISNAPVEVQKYAPAIALLSHKFKIAQSDSTQISIKSLVFGNVLQICQQERFREHLMLGDCSGFAINKNQIVTARHCIPDQKSCDDRVIIFGHQRPINNEFSPDQVFECKRIDASLEKNLGDLVLVTLNKPLPHEVPLKLPRADSNWPPVGLDLSFNAFVLGHPFGLSMIAAPLKSQFKHQTDISFGAQADVSQGASGSPLINTQSGEILGVLTGGDFDLKWNESQACNQSHICQDGECKGELFTSAQTLVKLLDARF